MRKANKPALAKFMLAGLPNVALPTIVKYVVDGGSLLHLIRWLKGCDLWSCNSIVSISCFQLVWKRFNCDLEWLFDRTFH